MGPSANAGKNVSPARMTVTPKRSPPKSGVSVGKVPADGATASLRTARPAIARIGTMRKNRPTRIARPRPCSSTAVFAVVPANAEPLLLPAT